PDICTAGQFKLLAGYAESVGSVFCNNGQMRCLRAGASLVCCAAPTLTQAATGTYTGAGLLFLDQGTTFNVANNVSLAPKLQLGPDRKSAAYGNTGRLRGASRMKPRDRTSRVATAETAGWTNQVRRS